MIIVTTETVAGYRTVQTFGEVFGIVVRSRGIGGNIVASLRSIFGGEIKEYTALVQDTRAQAIARLGDAAASAGANAVLMMRFDSGAISTMMNEVVAYGTAARIEPLP